MKGYRTLVINGAVALLPIVDFVANNGQLVASLMGPGAAAALSVLGLVNVVLRWITTTPMLQSE